MDMGGIPFLLPYREDGRALLQISKMHGKEYRFSAKSREICAGLRAGGRVKTYRQLIYRTAIVRKLYLDPSYPHYFSHQLS